MIAVLAVLGGGVAAVHGRAVVQNFGHSQWEDRLFIGHVKKIDSAVEAFQRGSYWRGLYRPLSTNLYYYLGKVLFNHRVAVYHTINLAFFLANVLLVFWLCRMFAPLASSLAVALIFGTRMASVETMLYSSQFQSLLPVFFALLGMIANLAAIRSGYRPRHVAVATICVFLGLLAKESMVVLPALYLLCHVLLPRHERGAVRPWRPILAHALPFLAVLVWYLLARRFLIVERNPWWQYDWDPLDLAGNYTAYLLSFLNLVVYPVIPVNPAVKLDSYPFIMAARASLPAQLALASLAMASLAAFLVLVLPRGTRSAQSLRWAVFGAGIFLLALAPVVIFKDRLLLYYGYVAHLGPSLVVVAVLRAPCAWLLDRSRRVLRLPHRKVA